MLTGYKCARGYTPFSYTKDAVTVVGGCLACSGMSSATANNNDPYAAGYVSCVQTAFAGTWSASRILVNG